MGLDQESPDAAPASASTSATPSPASLSPLPSSHSNGSLNKLVSTSSSSQQRRPLVNRSSNPIISTEDDDDDPIAFESDDSLNGHLKASATEEAMRMAATAAMSSMGVPVPAPALDSQQQQLLVTPESAVANSVGGAEEQSEIKMNGEAIHQPDVLASSSNISFSADSINIISAQPSVEISLSQLSSNGNVAIPTTLYPNKQNDDSPLSSRISSFNEANYIPKSLSDVSPTITPNNTLVSVTPASTPTNNNESSPNNTNDGGTNKNKPRRKSDSFDFDATHHNRKKGTGYLASQISLSTPTDVFASGCTLLQLCAIGNLPSVKEYVSRTFSNVNFRDYDRRTALHVAASEGHLDVVKYLVSKGAHVNKSDRWGGSPLDDAHRHRHTDVARYLRSKGGKTGSLNLASNLIAAAAAGDIEEVTMICADVGKVSQLALDLSSSRSKGLKGDVLDLSSSRGRVTKGKENSESGAGIKNAVDINKGDYDKRTALHLAAGEGHLDVVRFLIKRSANVNAEDRWGGRPLDDAMQKGHERVAEYLRTCGAKSAGEAPALRHGSLNLALGSISDVNSTNHSRPELLAEDENLRVEFAELEMIERIGSGAFGEIYKCRWRGILVAAKCIKASKIQKEWLLKNRADITEKDRIANRVEAIRQTAITENEKQLALDDFRRETAIMRRLRHPNIVMMLAYSHTEDVEVMISEICRCSLLDIFKANNISNSQIPKRTQIVYAQQLAQGMNHLHKSRPPIIHRDLKPANLLIDFSGTLKIADFGLAKIRPNPEQNENEVFLMTGETGSYRFMAPEVFRHEDYTESVDVYSYAMIFYYMLRSSPPWPGLSGVDAVTKAAVDGERPLIPRNVDERLSTLLKRCWDENGRARPSFDEIITCLNVYSHDVFKTNDKEVQSVPSHDKKCPGCIIS